MISKKLMSEIMDDKVKSIRIMNDTIFIYFENNNQEYFINIYELTHKCKEWAYTKYKIILTSKLFDYQIKNIFDCYLETGEKSRENIRNFAHPDFISNTEPEAIFKACQWILDNK